MSFFFRKPSHSRHSNQSACFLAHFETGRFCGSCFVFTPSSTSRPPAAVSFTFCWILRSSQHLVRVLIMSPPLRQPCPPTNTHVNRSTYLLGKMCAGGFIWTAFKVSSQQNTASRYYMLMRGGGKPASRESSTS